MKFIKLIYERFFQISHKPETIDDIEAAGVLYAGLTAWSGLYISGHVGGVLGALTSQGMLTKRYN